MVAMKRPCMARSSPSFRRGREWILWVWCTTFVRRVFRLSKNDLTTRNSESLFSCSSSPCFSEDSCRRIVGNKALFTHLLAEDKINISLFKTLHLILHWNTEVGESILFYFLKSYITCGAEKTLFGPTTTFLETIFSLNEWWSERPQRNDTGGGKFAAVKKHRPWPLIGRTMFLTREKRRSLLWLVRT